MARIATLLLAVWLFLTGRVEVQSWPARRCRSSWWRWSSWRPRVALRRDPARWVSFLAGAWLIAAPLALGYPGAAESLNSFTCGLAVMILASRANRTAT
jgi:amino acid transporter